MIVQYRIDVTDAVRKQLRVRIGKSGLATRAEVKRELERMWTRFVERAEEPVPLDRPELPKPARDPILELCMFTTSTLRGELARRDAR